MATYYLLNTTKISTPGLNGSIVEYLDAGKKIDSALYSVAAIQAAGGVLVPTSDAAAAAAALIAVKREKQGQNENIEFLPTLIMCAAVAGEVATMQANRVSTTSAAGATVAAAAAISPAATITPTISGKVRVRAWASVEALAAGTFTPVLNQGATTIAAPAQLTGAAGQTPTSPYVEVLVTGLTLGTAVTFNWVSTAGDATVTLGNGVTGIAAGMTAEEVP